MINTPLGQRIVVRFRKHVWMPTAKSKLFKIPEHTFYSPDEIKQIQIIQKAYKAQEASIMAFMKNEFYLPATRSKDVTADDTRKEMEVLFEENDRDNERVAKVREEFMSKRFEEMENRLIEAKLEREEELVKAGRKIDEFIKTQKSDPDSVVTPENIDAIIEKALGNPVSYESISSLYSSKNKSPAL